MGLREFTFEIRRASQLQTGRASGHQLQSRAWGRITAPSSLSFYAFSNPPEPVLSGPISRDTAILRYCDTIAAIPHIARYFLREVSASPKRCDTPRLVLSFTQTHPCDTPFCNVSRDNCAIPHKNKHEKSFAILSLQVSRDMKSIAAGPLRACIRVK